MKPLISPAVMRECEHNYFLTNHVKSIDVMERAARALADAILSEIPEGAVLHFACGTGGNGGDGTACARLLHNRYCCSIIQPREPRHPDAIENLRRARECGIPILTESAKRAPDVWVDALFGTGLTRAPIGDEAALIRRMNADRLSGARVYAADIPSGLDGGAGKAYDPCVQADHTITFQFLKAGLTLGDGLDCCGEITVADVGFPSEVFGPMDALLLEPIDLAGALPPRPRNLHKGQCGHLLIVAGSFGMTGAAALCASAALRSGAGLVTIACAKSIVPILQTLAPQAMCVPLEESNGVISPEALTTLSSTLSGKDAVVIGPGLTRRAPADAVRLVMESGLPAVIDADALNLLSANPHLLSLLRPHHVITPHPGEAARLLESTALSDRQQAERGLGEPSPSDIADPIGTARRLGTLGATALYKGAATVICGDRETYVSRSGCCGMARGGSGDVLSGILGALLAERSGRSPALTAAVASELHGLAGERAQAVLGDRAMNSRDVIDHLSEVFPR